MDLKQASLINHSIISFGLVFLSLWVISCGRNVRLLEPAYVQNEIIHQLGSNADKKLSVHYTGAGGVILKFDSTILITDPFFSNSHFLPILIKTAFGGYISNQEKFIQYGINRIPFGIHKTQAILITHAHYDHLMDVPWMFENGYFEKKHTKVIGNRTAVRLMEHFDAVDVLNAESYIFSKETETTWITTIPNVRILPILSQHAPHKGHIKAFSGEYTGELGKKGKNKTRLRDWREGRTISYLIDFIDGDDLQMRVFIQTSASDDPIGAPSREILNQKEVDLAILGVASYENSNNYPMHLIDALEPKALLFVHWENFFRKYTARKPRTVMGTDVVKFVKIIDKKYPHIPFWLPGPGTTLKLLF